MATKFSTGLRNGILATASVASQLNGGFLHIYAGAAPASADDDIGAATLLCTVSDNGTAAGVDFEAVAENAQLLKLASQTWKGANVESGTATFFRLVGASDTGAASTSEPRIQGSVGHAGADLNLASTALVATEEQIIDYFAVAVGA